MKRFHSTVPLVMCALALGACKERHADGDAGHAHGDGAAPAAQTPAMSNRVDIPAAVRSNLGITFATVERRNVASTLRVPGRFELQPSARREYRTMLPGRVEILVNQYQSVEQGTPLYRIDSPRWRDLQEQIAAAESALAQASAKLESMEPLRAAHRKHEESLTTKVALWTQRLEQLKTVRAAGGGSAKELAEVQGTLNATQAELAEIIEKDAELESRERELMAEAKGLRVRVDLLLESAAAYSGMSVADLLKPEAAVAARPVWRAMSALEVRSSGPGVVEALAASTGAMLDQTGLVLSTVRPGEVRFRAKALQSDLAKLRDGLKVLIVPPTGGAPASGSGLAASLTLGLVADADERTIDLLATPQGSGTSASWARAGVAGFMEVTLAGGSEELAIPLACVARDGVTPIIFRRDPANADKAIRLEADLGITDGRWVVVNSGVKQGDQIVLEGVYPLMLATSGSMPKGGHFHSDGTYHEGKD